MDNINSITFTVAKLCHEIANSLSIIRFLQEDLSYSENRDLEDLSKNIDLMTYIMDFFRNIYSVSDNRAKINEILLNILNLKGISLKGDTNIFSEVSANFENVICGILYICMKSCKSSDCILLKKQDNKIIIQIPNRTFPQNTIKAFQEEDIEETVFNIFILYIKHLAKSYGIIIDFNFDFNNNTTITLWNQK